MRYETIEFMLKVWDLMLAHGIRPNEFTYEILILFTCKTENLEFALQKLSDMSHEDLAPTLKTAQSIVSLACDVNQPRLAVELAEAFERSSVRRLDGIVWMKCLTASAEALYVSGITPITRNLC